MQHQEDFRSDKHSGSQPVCPDALERLWQAVYGGPMATPNTAACTSGDWFPFDADRPVIPMLRACTDHLRTMADTQARNRIQDRFLRLNCWLCSDEAPTSCGNLAAWKRGQTGWRLVAVHRELLRRAACGSERVLQETRPQLQGLCACHAIS